MKTNFKLFKTSQAIIKTLTPDERKMLPILIEACKKLDQIYLLQKNDKYPGGNFYPHGATKEEIEKAAELNPDIFSSFTIVEKNKNGSLKAVPFHEKYKDKLEKISPLIAKAATICKNPSIKNHLETLSQTILTGEYEKADLTWLNFKNSNLRFTFAPYEREIDRLFGIKKAYQAHIGVIDKTKTAQAENFKDILFLNPGHRSHSISKAKVLVEVQNVICFAGLTADSLYSREHLPTDYETREKYGSVIIGYLTTIDLKFEKLVFPIFNAIFEKQFRERYPKDVLEKGNYFNALFYGLARYIHKYPGAQERLKELYPIFDQANNLVSGIQHTKHLILKGVIDQKELEATMVTQICWMFSEWINKGIKVREPILKGDALVLKFLLERGALSQQDGISWPNFAKMFFEIENLASIFNRFLEEASYEEAKQFLDKHLTMDTFESFDKPLSKIKPI